MDSRVCMDRICRSQNGVSHLEHSSLGETPQQTLGARSSEVEPQTHNLPSPPQRGSEGLRREVDETGAAAASLSPTFTVGSAVLAIEDRLLVALASRGSLRIGQLLENVFGCSQDPKSHCLFYRSDHQIVASIEAWVAEHAE